MIENLVSGSEWRQKQTGARTASRPPNAPDTVAAEKKSAARIPNSERLYQLRCKEHDELADSIPLCGKIAQGSRSMKGRRMAGETYQER